MDNPFAFYEVIILILIIISILSLIVSIVMLLKSIDETDDSDTYKASITLSSVFWFISILSFFSVFWLNGDVSTTTAITAVAVYLTIGIATYIYEEIKFFRKANKQASKAVADDVWRFKRMEDFENFDSSKMEKFETFVKNRYYKSTVKPVSVITAWTSYWVYNTVTGGLKLFKKLSEWIENVGETSLTEKIRNRIYKMVVSK